MIISITIKVPVRPIPAEQCTTVGPGFGSNPSVVSKKEKNILLNFFTNFSKNIKRWGGDNKIVRRGLKKFQSLEKFQGILI